MAPSTPTILSILFLLLIHPLTSLAQTSPPPPSSPAAPAAPPAAPPAPQTKPTEDLPFMIIDKEWTQLFLGTFSIIFSIIIITSIYGFLWMPWWTRKMVEVEKEYNKREKERLAGGFGIKV